MIKWIKKIIVEFAKDWDDIDKLTSSRYRLHTVSRETFDLNNLGDIYEGRMVIEGFRDVDDFILVTRASRGVCKHGYSFDDMVTGY